MKFDAQLSEGIRRALAVAAAGAVLTTGAVVAPAALAEDTAAEAEAAPAEDVHKALVDVLNQYRADNGLEAVVEDTTMNQQAQDWADHLAQTGEFAHDELDVKAGVFAQNIAIGSSAEKASDVVLSQWAKNPGCNRHLVNPEHTKVGYGVAYMQTGDFKGQPVVVQKLGH